MADGRSDRGELDVVFVDGARRSFRVYRAGGDTVLQWPGEGGVPNEHVVRAENALSYAGWVRELWEVFEVAVRTYDFVPARGK